MPQGLSWQTAVTELTDPADARLIGFVFLATFAVVSIGLSRVVPLDVYIPMTLVLFVLCSKVVIEQYLTWPLAWLALALWLRPRRTAAAGALVLLVFTVVGTLANETFHPWGRAPSVFVWAVTGAGLLYLAAGLHDAARAAARPARSALEPDRLPLELRPVQLGVEAARREQVGMRAGFHDVAVLEHHDQVGVEDGREPVRDHQ